MGVESVIVWARIFSLFIFFFSLASLAFLFGQSTITAQVIAEPLDLQMYTKAICHQEGGIRDCQDKLFVRIEGIESEVEGSMVDGKGSWRITSS